ncbi:MAG: PLP-dependent transferase [Verrucomicrobiota bacterium]
MSSMLKHHPLGQPIPDSVHAVCVSLPTMQDVIGYEEKRVETLEQVKFAYPRFVFHDYVLRATEWAAEQAGLVGQASYALCSVKAAQEMLEWMNLKQGGITPCAGFVLAHFPSSPDACAKAKRYLQHTGTSISSRQAEDCLHAAELLTERQSEHRFKGSAEDHVIAALQQYLDTDQLALCASGMNAFYASLKATQQVQRPRGKKVYLQLGWLYLDTMKILQGFLSEDERVIVLHDVFDKAAIEAVFAEHGSNLAAVVTELPTNPLVQTPDVPHLSALCQQHRAVRIFDPSLAGVVNVDILEHTDFLPTSLTKYAANAGDVMAGLLAVNTQSPLAESLWSAVQREIEPPYICDVQRLAEEIGEMPAVAAQVNHNARELAERLQTSDKIKRVYAPCSGVSAHNYKTIARTDSSVGAIITVELNEPLSVFYDHATVVKGPSFGTTYTMMCPFMYLAHYDLVSTSEGRSNLNDRGLDPDLLRLSVGTEPIEDIVSALGL